MGIFDEIRGAFDRHNNGHVQLIIINVIVFVLTAILYVFSGGGGPGSVYDVTIDWVAIPPQFGEFATKAWTLFTYAFVHSINPLHIAFNMIALYWFARLLIEYLGNDKFIAVYVLGIIAGGLAFLLTHNLIPFYIGRGAGLIGASAAVNAVIVAAATLLPDYTFFMLFLGPVRIKWIALAYVLLSFIGTVQGNAGGDIAHLGGALIGFIYIKQLQVGVDWGRWVTTTLNWFSGLFRPSPKVKVTYRKTEKARTSTAKQSFNKATQEEIDAILDKISDKGYDALTKEEKEKLFNASKK